MRVNERLRMSTLSAQRSLMHYAAKDCFEPAPVLSFLKLVGTNKSCSSPVLFGPSRMDLSGPSARDLEKSALAG